MWGPQLLDSPASRLTAAEGDALRVLLAAIPTFMAALGAARDAGGDRPAPSAQREWADWEALSTRPAWQALARQAAC